MFRPIQQYSRHLLTAPIKRGYSTQGVTPKIEPHTVLTYQFIPDVLDKRPAHRVAHLYHVAKAKEDGRLALAGALDPPTQGALLIFKGDCKDYVQQFAQNDPYVTNGLVTSFEVKKWSTVCVESSETYKQ